MAKLQGMDKVVRDTSQEPSIARKGVRRFGPAAALVPLALFLIYMVASASAPWKTTHETWGKAPYSQEVVAFAERRGSYEPGRDCRAAGGNKPEEEKAQRVPAL